MYHVDVWSYSVCVLTYLKSYLKGSNFSLLQTLQQWTFLDMVIVLQNEFLETESLGQVYVCMLKKPGGILPSQKSLPVNISVNRLCLEKPVLIII